MHLRNRPQTIDDVVGNEALKKSLSACDSRVLMFEGTRGCGKTSIANILSKNFVDSEHNIEEINCGADTGVAKTREVIDNFNKPSIFGNRKAFIFDEIHMLSHSAQSALLTELEKLPDYIMVIACTTDPHKTLPTLLERFVRYKVKSLTAKQSIALINNVSEKENISIPRWLKAIIVESCDGNPRKILTGLNKVKNITNESEARYLLELNKLDGIPEDSMLLFKLLYKDLKEWNKVVSAINGVLSNKSANSVRSDLLNILASRSTSVYFNDSEIDKTLRFYEVLSDEIVYPERANFILTILKLFKKE